MRPLTGTGRFGERRERGSTLLLFPAAILVVMALSAIAVDLSVLHGAQRDLRRVVHAAADDAAASVDIDLLRRTGDVRLDLEAARQLVAARLTEFPAAVDAVTAIHVEAGPRPNSLAVRVDATVRHVFGRALPGVPEVEHLHVSVVSQLQPA